MEDDYIDIPEGPSGTVTFTPDPIYKPDGEEVRIDGRIVGRIRRMRSGAYTGTATISGLSVVGDYVPTGPGSQEMFRRPIRSDAIRLVLGQARKDLNDEAREKRR